MQSDNNSNLQQYWAEGIEVAVDSSFLMLNIYLRLFSNIGVF